MPKNLYISNGHGIPDLAAKASGWRKSFEISDVERVDIIAIIEFKLPRLLPDFHLKVVPDQSIGSDAKTIISPPTIIVRKSVYMAAYEGDYKARFVLAHELGHLILHRKFENEEMHHFDGEYEENIPELNALTSSEDQATIFGRFFLAPPRIACRYKHSVQQLARVAGIPLSEAATSITLSKRQEFFSS